MAIDHGHGADAGRNPGVAYDKTDLGARGILFFFLGLAVFGILMQLIVLGMYAGMTRFAVKHEVEASPLAPQTYTPRSEVLQNTANVNIQQFPQPRLLHHVRGSGEMTKFLLQEAAVLNAKPWQDADGNVHLPIHEAMNAVLPHLPSRAGGVPLPNYPGAAREYSYPSPRPVTPTTGALESPLQPESAASSAAASATQSPSQSATPMPESGTSNTGQ